MMITLSELCLGNAYGDSDDIGTVWCWDRGDYQRLGDSIGKNHHLTKLDVAEEIATETVANDDLIAGLKQNLSITQLKLTGEHVDIAHGAGQQILDAYQGKNNQLTHLQIWDCYLTHASITKTLKCNNLQDIELIYCQIIDDQLLPTIEAVRGNTSLEKISLYGNRIGNAGCEAIATLLADPNCNITNFDLRENNIGNVGATAIANSLPNNNKLRRLFLHVNPIINNVQGAWDLQSAFSQALCNASSISSTYSSNHTLKFLELPHFMNDQLYDILELNEDTNKQHVA